MESLLKSDEIRCKKLFFRNSKRNQDDVYYYARDVLRCLDCTNRADVSKVLSKIRKENIFTISELYDIYIRIKN